MTTQKISDVGTAYIEMPAKNHFNIFVKWGYETSKLYAANSYKYEPLLKVLVIDGVILSKVENLVFSF